MVFEEIERFSETGIFLVLMDDMEINALCGMLQ